MIPMFPKGSKERVLLEKRVAMCCAAQSREIDKTKIGQAVKGTPSFWKQRLRPEEKDTLEEKETKEFYNRIMCGTKPYFFRYKYKDLSSKYNSYVLDKEEVCWGNFGCTLKELFSIEKKELEEEQLKFINGFYRDLPVVDSDCVMNKICHYIESIDFDIKKKVRNYDDFDYKLLKSKDFKEKDFDEKKYESVVNTYKECFKEYIVDRKVWEKNKNRIKNIAEDSKTPKDVFIEKLKKHFNEIEQNDEILCEYLLKLFYEDVLSANKSILWDISGKQLYSNVLKKTPEALIPVKDELGSLVYLYEKYRLTPVDLKETEKEKSYV